MRATFTRPRLERGKTCNAATLHAAVLAACLVAGGLCAPAALAQRPQADARPCTEVENDSERLACYDRSLRPQRPAPAPAAAAAPAAPAEPVAGAQPPREVRNATPAVAPAPPAAPAARAAKPSKKDEIINGASLSIVIANVRGQPGRNVFTTETGEVWTQTDGRPAFLPKLPFRAEIKPGVVGSFFLVPLDGQAIRVYRGP